MQTISIIIPCYNEEAYIASTLACLQNLNPAPLEVLLVDGGSTDQTLFITEGFPVKVISSAKGRAEQMNVGATQASGDLLCFIHADTLVPQDILKWIQATLVNPKIACGAFVSVMKGRRTRWFTSFHNYIKTYYAPFIYRPHLCLFKGLRLLFGDQVIFCRRKDFQKVGGFDPGDLVMEEANFCLRMNKLGRIKQIHHVVESSDRRVAHWGEFKANVIYFFMAVGWALRIPSHKLAQYYRDIR